MTIIVIEGPDASGKSTLAKHLAHVLDRTIQPSEGPPKYPGEINERLARYSTLGDDIIYDRHPVVSEEVYAYALRRTTDVSLVTMQYFYAQRPLFIYCDPLTRDLPRTHNKKPHDTPEHLYAVHENYERLVTAYRSWALTHAHIIYRIGDDYDRIAHYVIDYVRDIREFHIKFGIAYDGPPRPLSPDLKDFRVRFLAEELCEYAGVPAITKTLIQAALKEKQRDVPLADQFDALIDLVYVALGTAHLHGFPFPNGWAMVHAANMRKIRAPSAEHSTRGHAADVIKPEGWQHPNISRALGDDDEEMADHQAHKILRS
jgi:predicted HAD superfamily Cof-like phosphohydrolase